MSAQHKANRYAFQAATNRFYRRPTDENLGAVEAALDQVKFDRLEAETEPAAEAEQPALELDSESAEE
jgi:hypothetical protein